MHIASFVIPVPEESREAYHAWAKHSAGLLKDLGCLEVVEAWEDEVPDGQLTDFRKAVKAAPGEKIAVAWQVWPDKAAMKAAEARMQDDPRFEPWAEMPFDPARIIFGSFAPLHVMGRD